MSNCDQQPQSEGVPPLSGSVSPDRRDTYPPLSHGQDESQTWLAYDRAANCSPGSAPPEPVDCLAEETRSMVIEDTLPRHRGPSLNKFQTIMQMKERTRAKADTKTKSHLSPESPMRRSTSLLFGLVGFGFMPLQWVITRCSTSWTASRFHHILKSGQIAYQTVLR